MHWIWVDFGMKAWRGLDRGEGFIWTMFFFFYSYFGFFLIFWSPFPSCAFGGKERSQLINILAFERIKCGTQIIFYAAMLIFLKANFWWSCVAWLVLLFALFFTYKFLVLHFCLFIYLFIFPSSHMTSLACSARLFSPLKPFTSIFKI